MTRANYSSEAFGPMGNSLVLAGVLIREMSSLCTEVESLRLDLFLVHLSGDVVVPFGNRPRSSQSPVRVPSNPSSRSLTLLRPVSAVSLSSVPLSPPRLSELIFPGIANYRRLSSPGTYLSKDTYRPAISSRVTVRPIRGRRRLDHTNSQSFPCLIYTAHITPLL